MGRRKEKKLYQKIVMDGVVVGIVDPMKERGAIRRLGRLRGVKVVIASEEEYVLWRVKQKRKSKF